MTNPSLPPTPLTSHTNDHQAHLHYLRACLSLAQQSPPKPTNFRVGAILLSRTPLSPDSPRTYNDTILSTGYTLELPGNTHAEQCALAKYAARHGVTDERIGEVLPPPPSPPLPPQSSGPGIYKAPEGEQKNIILYVTMEPCGKRLSGNMPQENHHAASVGLEASQGSAAGGARRKSGIGKVYFGVKEPGTFVGQSVGCKMLYEAGVEWEVVEGMEEEILKVAMAGHEETGEEKGVGDEERGTNVDDISEEEKRRQAALPRNPKKRIMEADI
ncbi:hypothetical protein I7I51_07020 [Histoplasma capsulatum]|uniref:CMP/dCMP-type deaminase domain-containing protein n=1 Tax=Ajellomyces capsulatus TaxID=5037 RepID=A0A8A1MQ19_AJECA|nr:conserved hypothetical protein [Histoplasma mississippiense (nom. inval.)]EDN10144.1 conserved hypothetical protein [Histoplasma mississippiense (nom. inval.)]QSS66167.1 hypothetical protein I7I51_07020 [Histoplasma capsulatum]